MNFPSSPSLNQTYTLGIKTWKYNGTAWDLIADALNSSLVTTALGFTPENSVNKGVVNGYASLNGSGVVPTAQLPTSVFQPLDADLTAIAALAGTSGLLKKTAADTWTLDTNSYITGNQSITYSGDASGSGTTAVTLTLANSGVTAGTYKSVTVDAKGRVTAGTNPTTLSGYGITDAQPLDADLTAIAALAGTSGLLKKTAADTWTLDTNTYITGNQSITYSGDATGSGTTAVTLTLVDIGVTAGTYNNSATSVTPITVDAKGRVTSTGTAVTITPAFSSLTSKPTTISGYGITDAYTKTQVDSFLQGLDPKASVVVATTANITLSATQTIDGIAVVAGDRVLVKNQTTTAQNGIYTVAAGSWTRATDANAWTELPGAYVFVEKGTLYADTGWVCTVDQSGTLDTTAITWSQFAGAGSYTSGTGISITGTQIALTSGVATAGTYKSVTIDTYGRVTGGTNPTTLSGYGITDALALSGGTLTGAVTSSSKFTSTDDNNVNGSNFTVNTSTKSTTLYAYDVQRSGSTVGGITIAGVGVFAAGTTIGGNTAIHAGNYNNYAPTLTGTGASGTWGINITGNAATLTNFSASYSGSAGSADAPANLNVVGYVVQAGLPFSQGDGGIYTAGYSTSWYHQIFGDFRTGQIAVRGKNSGTWQSWYLIPSLGYNSGSSSGLYAGAFYDTANTGYYVDPASTSNLAATYIAGHYYGSDNANNILLKTSTTGSSGLLLRDSAGNFRAQLYGDGTNYGFLNGGWAAWDLQKTLGGNLYLNGNGSYYLNPANDNNFYRVYVQGDTRSPIYYDLNNTGYYVDPASFSYMNRLGLAGGLSNETSITRVVSPGGGDFKSNTSSAAGAIKIRLPQTWTNTMIRFTVKVYTYDGLSFDITCGGYNYSPSTYWVNTFAYMGTADRPALNVRFAHDGTYCCVFIGELAGSWSYPQIAVTDVQLGYSSYGAATWDSGWSVSLETSSFGTVTATQTAYPHTSSVNNTNPAYSSIYYDANNTGYYADPNNSSSLYVTYANYYRRQAAGYGFLDGGYTSQETTATSGPIYTIGGGYYPAATSLGNMYGVGYTLGTVSGISRPGVWGFYVASGGTARHFFDSDNGRGYSTGSYYAPLYYDLDNTNYYVDPASTSYLNVLYVGGVQVVPGSGGGSWSVKSSAYTATSGDNLMVDTSSGTITVTLPASPSAGNSVQFADAKGTWSTNALIVARNGKTIMGVSEDMYASNSNASFTMVYNGSDWRII